MVVKVLENKIKEMKSQFKEYRLTPQRKLVLEIFMENKDRHLSAEELYQLSRDKGEDIGLATIYRTLELLEELGLLQKMNFGDGRSRYEMVPTGMLARHHHHHHHLICLECSRILEVEEDLLSQLERVVEEQHNFQIVNHYLQFFGYCPSCRQDSKKK
jgi:Fur family transcriptional regulator, ferric uptake regulator